ncbi:Protein of unknown function [Prevotella sp. KH2C16]|nr:Protein of unknown function [Prevotella sp. KH2C16]
MLLSSCSGKKEASDAPALDTIPMMVMQIQRCSRLYTAEYQLHKIITHDDTKKLEGSFMNKDFSIDLPLGKRKIALPLDATVKAYIDFSGFSEKNIRKRGGRIEVILPDPKVVLTSTKIKHEDVKQYVALTRSNFTDEELTGYEQQGRDQIVKAIPQLGIIETARSSAASILIPMMEQMGYKRENIKITFRKDFTLDDIQRLIDKTTIENGKADQ